MAQRYQVAIARDPDIGAAVRRAIELVGGIERYVRPGDHVVIKVNMFTQGTPESGLVTHPAVVLEVARLCRGRGARVQVVERLPYYDLIFRGYEEIEQMAELVALEKVEHRHMALPGARSLLCQVPWPNLADECDVFINIPGLRNHALTRFSNGMKNLMGLLPDHATRLVHQYGLDGSICDLNYYRPSDLVVTDAVYTLEGNFPSEGSPLRTDLIMAADNVVAADLAAVPLMGLNPREVLYLQEAIRRGLGPAALDEVELLGDGLEEVQATFAIHPAPQDPEACRGAFNLSAEWACASCRRALAGGLLAASHRPELAGMEGVTILAGHQPQDSKVGSGRVLAYGNCAYRYRDLGHYEPGCPPLAYQVLQGLRELQLRLLQPVVPSVAWPTWPIEEVVPVAASAGYLGLEAWAMHLDRYTQSHGGIAPLAELLREYGLQVPAIDLPSLDVVTDLEGSLARVELALGYARALAASLLRLSIDGGGSAAASNATWRAAICGLKQICQRGLEGGIQFALQARPGHLHDTAEAALRLIRQVGLPNLGVDLDVPGLQASGEDPVGAMRRLEPWLRMVHLPQPATAGDAAFLAALRGSRFAGQVTVFLGSDDPAGAAARELGHLRRALGDRLAAETG